MVSLARDGRQNHQESDTTEIVNEFFIFISVLFSTSSFIFIFFQLTFILFRNKNVFCGFSLLTITLL